MRVRQKRSQSNPKRQSLEGGRKEVVFFDHDVTPLALYEIANVVVHILPKDLPIRQNTVDRLNDAAQTLRPILLLSRQIANPCRNRWISKPQLGKDQFFLGVMIQFGIELEVADNRAITS